VPSYILTGAPGAGKTAILRLLEVSGYRVVEEAATDVIALDNALGSAEPWRDPAFIDKVITLQRRRQDAVRAADGVTVFFDRSPACTLALSRYLGFTASRLLDEEVREALAAATYEPAVFFIRNQGFVRPTAARRISFDDSLVFERLHEQVYRDLGFELVDVPPGPLPDRVALIRQKVSRPEQDGSR
jgi:predicted ATPase